MAKRPTPEMWAEIRTALGTDQFRLLWIKPEENVLLGWWAICQYLSIRDRKTLARWTDDYALPCIKRPDGLWMSTMTSIDQWIMLASQVQYSNRTRDGVNAEQNRARRRQSKAELQAALERGRAEGPAEPIRPEALPRPAGGVAGVQPGPRGD